MKVSIPQSEVMLTVGGTGGGYTILGEQYLGQWRYWRAAGDGDAGMWDDDVTAGNLPQALPERIEPSINCFQTLDEALATLNECWPILYPVAVHPAVAVQVLAKVEEYIAKHKNNGKRGYLSNWKALCLAV